VAKDSAPAPAADPLISVVVPTRDRPQTLRTCLTALAAQTAADRLEVVVVDDGSVAAREVAAAAAAHPRVRLIRQDTAGPAAARNAGARGAHGRIVCFIDDDCIAESDWAEKLAAVIESGADAVAGTSLRTGGALAEAADIISSAPATAEAFAPSNNLACTKVVVDAVPFDESYPEAAGEDREWCARLLEEGYELRSEPAARVLHRQHLTLFSFLRRQIRYGEGARRFRTNTSRPLEPIGFYVALMRRGFGHGFRVGALVAVAQVATALGWARAWTAARGGDRS
jgi:glycosyltransferase involved in cell wall biosynthesis